MESICEPRPAGIARWIKEPFCGLSHGVGALFSAIGLVLLLQFSRSEPSAVVSVIIYGVSLILLFSASCLVHSLHCSQRTENWLERCDYAAIFFLIAGTYTPICLNTLQGAWGLSLLSIEWTLAILGAAAVLRYGPQRLWVLMYVPMGWMVLVASAPMLARMDWGLLLLLLAGGMVYSLGAIVFVTRRPHLWPGRFNYHDLWHVMVLLGAACHFAVVHQVTTSS